MFKHNVVSFINNKGRDRTFPNWIETGPPVTLETKHGSNNITTVFKNADTFNIDFASGTFRSHDSNFTRKTIEIKWR